MSPVRARPRIGLTPDVGAQPTPETEYALRRNYADAILEAGGLPLILAYGEADACLDVVDAVVVTGGMFDIDPALYGGAAMPDIVMKSERTAFEKALLEGALARDMPILGICNGMQLLAAILGGGLVQHIPAEVTGALEHKPQISAAQPHHVIDIHPGSRLEILSGAERHSVNSVHHQAVKPSSHYQAVARALDGVIEAIEVPCRHFCLGLQWHPEYHAGAADRAIWKGFCESAADFARLRKSGSE